MQLSAIKRTSKAKNVVVDKNSIVMVYPSSSSKIWDSIYELNILNTSNVGIVVPNKFYTFLKKRFNGRLHFLDCKKNLMEKHDVSKRIRVYPTFSAFKNPERETINQRKFIYYDMSMISDAVSYFSSHDGFSEKRILGLFINNLQEEYKSVKDQNPGKNVITVLHVKNTNDFAYNFLIDFKRIRSLMSSELSEGKFSDNFVYVAAGKYFFPVLERNDKTGEYMPIIPQISYMQSLVTALETSEDINNTPLIQSDEVAETPAVSSDNIVGMIVNALSDKTMQLVPTSQARLSDVPKTVDAITNAKETGKPLPGSVTKPKEEFKTVTTSPVSVKATVVDDKIDIHVDNAQLTKVLKAFKVKNADVIANVRAAIDTYIKEHNDLPSRMTAEELILKSINYMIHGTDTVDPAYIQNPSLLFAKLKNIDAFSVPLEFPKDNPHIAYQPKDIITIDKVSGQHRQKYEFDQQIHENIRKVFGILEEQKKYPIQVENIDWEYVDTDSDRLIEYHITLRNNTGDKKPYVINLYVPSPVNEKYFKLGGNKYIFSSQQHLKVLTKTMNTDVRILTNYAIVRLSVENMKFNMSDINDILRYIEQRYPNLITEANDSKATFADGSTIYFTGNNVYTDVDHNVIIDAETNKLVDTANNNLVLKQNRFEYLFDVIISVIHSVNPNDNLTKTRKSIPYIALYLSGGKIPFIIFMWSQKGLLSTLNTFGINYEITDDPTDKGDIFLELSNGKYLVVMPENTRERLLANGLIIHKIKYPITNLDSPDEIRPFITDKYGARFNTLIDNSVQNMIDPISKELLTFDNYPTNLPGLLSGPALDMLLNQQPSALADMRIYRSRMSEIMLRIMYKQLTRAFNSYMYKVEFGDDNAKLQIVDKYIVNEFLGRNPPNESQERSAVMSIELTSAVNPIDE